MALANKLPGTKAAIDASMWKSNTLIMQGSDVVPLEGLRHVLERLQKPTHVRRVVPALVHDLNACPPRAVVRI